MEERNGYRKPPAAPVEIEGGGMSWYYACGECHGEVRTGADRCEHCGAFLIWGKVFLDGLKKGREKG